MAEEKTEALAIPKQGGQYNDELKKLTQIQDGDFYEVWDSRTRMKRKEPSARVLRNWANEKRISTEIVQVIHTPEHVQVMVHGWIGKKTEPQIETTEVVTINYMDYARQYLFDKMRKDSNIAWEEDKTGMPIPKDPKLKLEWFEYINRKKLFGDREAETKAESRIFKKLLGFEWRDKEEIQAEEEDVKIVQDGIKKENDGDGPTCDICGVTMKKSKYERADGKLWYCPGKDGKKCNNVM